MTSSLNKILNGKFNNLKQIGPKSWLLCDENGKSYYLVDKIFLLTNMVNI